jgi:hypothetical protein
MTLDTMLLLSDTHRKPIISVTAVLLPFVTYLLTLPSILGRKERTEHKNWGTYILAGDPNLHIDGLIQIKGVSPPCDWLLSPVSVLGGGAQLGNNSNVGTSPYLLSFSAMKYISQWSFKLNIMYSCLFPSRVYCLGD